MRLALLALLHTATAAPPPSPPTPAQPGDLAAWTARTGLPLAQPEALRRVGEGLVLLGPGESLLLEPAPSPPSDAGLDAALAAQVAPFTELGLIATPATTVACQVGGAPARCRAASVEVAPGATLSLLAARAPGADWRLVCLDRRPDDPGPCAAAVALDPPG